MNDQTPAAVVATYFDALRRDDIPQAMGLLSPQIVWHQPGANRFSGSHTGIDGVGKLLAGMMEVSEGSFQLNVTGTPMVNQNLVAVPVHFQGQRPGASMNMSGIDLLTVSDGRIVEVRLFSEDSVAEDKFWGQPV